MVKIGGSKTANKPKNVNFTKIGGLITFAETWGKFKRVWLRGWTPLDTN